MEERKFSEQELVRRKNYDKASQRESVLHAYSRSRWSNPVICT